MKVVPSIEVKTQKDIEGFFKARNIKFVEASSLKKELYRQLGLSSLLEPITSVASMSHGKTNFGFSLIIQNEAYCLKYQYCDTEVTCKEGRFKITSDPLKEGFYKFDGDEICSFIEYCVEDGLDFQVLSTKAIDKGLLIAAIK